MKQAITEGEPSTFGGRVRASLGPSGLPSDDRGRMRLVVDNLVLHLHPTKVNTRSLSLTYTWGLGGLSAMLVMILAVTGIMLTNNYTPSPAEAYQSILNLRSNVWFGDFLRNLALRALHALVNHHAVRAEPERTLAYIDRLLALEPAHEAAHRHKMLLLARDGERAAALHQYDACRRALQALDAEPDGETTALYERIRGGTESHASRAVRPPGPGLHVPLIPLVGREAEVAEIRARLQDPSCRLLTLTGPGGVGKTHLAVRVAEEMLSPDGFLDGVYVVPVGFLLAVKAIAPAIAQALDLPLTEGERSQQQVVDHLHGKQVLLVMDGFEHLTAGAGLLVDLLHAIPGLKILATSRARLDVEGETLLPIQGLACSERLPEDREALAASPAVQLFVSRARQIQAGLELTDAELLDVARLCHLVGGLPLAILLAASWAGMLTPAEITAELAGELDRGLDLLQTDGPNLPFPQRSMRAVFDRSWGLLADRERQLLAGLSVFRGGFTLEAAHQVTDAALQELRVLMDQSLLQRAAGGRYTIHELLRHYAGEKLAATPGAAQVACDRHSAHFAATVAQRWLDFQGPRHQLALAEMGAENGNLRAAWDWSVARGHVGQLDQAMDGLCYFYKWLGRYEEGESLCRRVVEGLADAGVWRRQEPPDPSAVSLAEEPAERQRVLARALAWQGVFCGRLGRRQQAGELLRHSLDLLDDLAWTGPEGVLGPGQEIQHARAFVLWRLGNLAAELDHEDAQRLYRHSLALYRVLENSWGTSGVLEALGRIAAFSGEGDTPRHALEESLAL
ncbi:MAG: NACHT domain-containing protein [Chloroflexi bacterium]|nr:NACHT domain-containing protein [Chloroflexota bacterium]